MGKHFSHKIWRHAQARFLERHGIELTKELSDQIKFKIRKLSDASFLGTSKHAEHRKAYRVLLYDKKFVIVIFDRKRNQIVTTYPDGVDIGTIGIYWHIPAKPYKSWIIFNSGLSQ